MATTPIFGINARLYRNTATYATPTWLHVDIISNLSYNREPEIQEFYIRRSRVKYKVKTGIDFAITGNLLAELDTVEYGIWDDAMDGDNVLDLLVLNAAMTVVGARGIRADFQVGGAEESQNPTDIIMPNFTLNVYPTEHVPNKAIVETGPTVVFTPLQLNMAITSAFGAAGSLGGRSIESARAAFFDSDKVMRAMDAATRKALSKAGAFIRTSAISSIKKAPKVDPRTGLAKRGRRKKGAVVVDAIAKPGNPPYGHANQKLKKQIFWAYDSSTKSVVIGPAKFASSRGGPEFLEYGGTTTIRNKRGRSRTEHFVGNPFMHPAMEKGLGDLLAKFKDSM